MKKNYLILFSLIISLFCYADPIEPNKAIEIAKSFYSSKSSFRSSNDLQFKIDYTRTDTGGFRAKGEKAPNLYYVINVGDSNGFVIVSGDDKVKSIIGYSTKGEFNHHEMPENLSAWMEEYENVIKEAIANPNLGKYESSVAFRSSEPNNSDAISPLLDIMGIKWNQNTPYNDVCPIEEVNKKKSASGCVATALSQVMRYHEWPKKVEAFDAVYSYRVRITADGKNGYKHKTVSFPTTEYRWEDMLPQYKPGQYNKQQAKAVAELTYHVGAAMSMQYANSSGSFTQEAVKVLPKVFNYDKNIEYFQRKNFSQAEWYEKIKNDLKQGLPVIYSGYSIGGGHAFVCDGYDSNDLFHINWGWGGSANGFFELASLSPQSHGIGGGVGGYSSGQGVILGCRPPQHASKVFDIQFSADGISPASTSLINGKKYNFTVDNIHNYSWRAYKNGEIGIALFDAEGNILPNSQVTKSLGYAAPLTLYSKSTMFSLSIDGLEEGKRYTLNPVVKTSKGLEKMLYQSNKQGYLIVEKSGDNIKLSKRDLNPKLEMGKTEISKSNDIYSHAKLKYNISTSITNLNKENVYSSLIRLALHDSKSNTYTELNREVITLEPGEKKDFNFNSIIRNNVNRGLLKPGKYNLVVLFDKTNSGNNNSATEGILNPEGKPFTIEIKKLNYNDDAKLEKITVANVPDTLKRGELNDISFSITTKDELYLNYLYLCFIVDGGNFNDNQKRLLVRDVMLRKGQTLDLKEVLNVDYINDQSGTFCIYYRSGKYVHECFSQKVTITGEPQKHVVKLQQSKDFEVPEKVEIGEKFDLTLSIDNKGDNCNTKVEVILFKEEAGSDIFTDASVVPGDTIHSQFINLDKGEKKEFLVSPRFPNLEEGNYYIKVNYWSGDKLIDLTNSENLVVYKKVKAVKPSPSELQVKDVLNFVDSVGLFGKHTFELAIINSGATYNGQFKLSICPNGDKSKKQELSIVEAYIEKGETKDFSFNHVFTDEPLGEYSFVVEFLKGDKYNELTTSPKMRLLGASNLITEKEIDFPGSVQIDEFFSWSATIKNEGENYKGPLKLTVAPANAPNLKYVIYNKQCEIARGDSFNFQYVPKEKEEFFFNFNGIVDGDHYITLEYGENRVVTKSGSPYMKKTHIRRPPVLELDKKTYLCSDTVKIGEMINVKAKITNYGGDLKRALAFRMQPKGGQWKDGRIIAEIKNMQLLADASIDIDEQLKVPEEFKKEGTYEFKIFYYRNKFVYQVAGSTRTVVIDKAGKVVVVKPNDPDPVKPVKPVKEITVGPNPCKNNNLNVRLPLGFTDLRIFDYSGRIVYTQKINSKQAIVIPIHTIPKGVYLISATSSDGKKKTSSRFIKQ